MNRRVCATLDDPRCGNDRDQVGPDRLQRQLFLRGKNGPGAAGQTGQVLALHGEAAVWRGHVCVDRRPLRFGLKPDRLHEAGQVMRLAQGRLVGKPAAECAGHIAVNRFVRSFGKVGRDWHGQLDCLALTLVRLERHPGAKIMAGLNGVRDEPDRLDDRGLAPGLDVDLAVDGLDPHRRKGVANQQDGDRRQRVEECRGSHLPGVTLAAAGIAQANRLMAPELKPRGQPGGELFGQVPLGVDRTCQHGQKQGGQEGRLADHLHLIEVRVGIAARLDPNAHRQHVGLAADGPGHAGADVGIEHAHDPQRRAHLHAHAGTGVNRVNVAGHHRQLARAQAEHGMAEAVNAIALDMRHGSDAGEIEVAHHHGDRKAEHRGRAHFRPARDECARPPRRRPSVPCPAAAPGFRAPPAPAG